MWPTEGNNADGYIYLRIHASPASSTSSTITSCHSQTGCMVSSQMSQNGRSFRPLQRLRARRAFFDSGEWASSKQQHAATGEELPIAWKVLGPTIAGLEPATQADTRAHAAQDLDSAHMHAQHAHDATATTGPAQLSCRAAHAEPHAAARHLTVPTGGQPLAHQRRPSRLSNPFTSHP